MLEKAVPYGIVILKEWMANPETGSNVISISGPIQLVTAKEDFGFIPKGNESNWGIRIGSNASLLILRCQIRGVYWGQKLQTHSNVHWAFE